jgi:hypothetical protein
MDKSIVADEDQAAAPRGHFLHVRYRFLKHDDGWQVASDKRERPVFQLPRRIAFRVNIGKLLKLQRAFEGQRIGCSATEIEHVADVGNLMSGLTTYETAGDRP